ncbi:MAG TPA: GDSL-type esterase/lipase family protein [Pseudomonadales bacterium]|nr:GDSL-type esterase/lipase family protein [Pseudomonadales bacterium]
MIAERRPAPYNRWATLAGIAMHRHAFSLYCLLLSICAVFAAEFVLIPHMYSLPRATLLAGFAATPSEVIDGQTINSLGFTGDEIGLQKPADTLRVLVLGSSSMFNRHLGERLKAALQQKTGKKIELLDAGIRSHTTQADVVKLKMLAPYQWDIVLFYNGINDLWANHVLPEDFYDDYRQLDPWNHRNLLLDNSLLARYSYNFFYYKVKPFAQYQFVFPKKPYINAANFSSLSVFTANLEQIVAISKSIGAKPVLMTFAFHIPGNYSRQAFLDKQLDYSNPDNYDSREVNNWGPPEYVREGLTRQNKIIRDVAEKNGVALIDVDAKMSEQGRWFGDVCHFNDAGVDVFTALVAEALPL